MDASVQGAVASVIVPSHRGAHRLRVLLPALARQEIGEPWEVVVALDGTLDESPDILAEWADRLPLVVTATTEPQGVVAALNRGYGVATGRVLIRCDDDLEPGPDMVRRHVDHHRGRDDLGVIGATRDVFPDTPYAAVYGRRANERGLAAAYVRPAPLRWIGWAAHNSVTRATWDRLGGFDRRFIYGQDSELGVRLAEGGIEIITDPELELPHHGPSTTTATRIPRAFVSGASQILFSEVHPGSRPSPGRPRGLKATSYDLVVRSVTGTVRSREAFAKIGQWTDLALPRLPKSVGSILVEVLVDAAGRSGRAHGTSDLAAYKGQKVDELTRERQHPHD